MAHNLFFIEPWLTPDMFAETLCRDVGLEVVRYAPTIAESIRNQVMDFESIYAVTLPTEDNMRVDINVSERVILGSIDLKDASFISFFFFFFFSLICKSAR